MSSNNNRPPFIYRGGGMMMHPPFEQQDSLLFGFFVKSDLTKLQRLCDQCLNAVAQQQYIFEPLSDYVMMTFTRINKCYSLHPSDRAKGWGGEIDTSLWVPVGQYIEKDGKKVLDRIHWFTPYIWVDQIMTVLNGREIFGYPKYMGRFEMPETPENADLFSIDVNAFKTYSPETESAYHHLLDIKRKPGNIKDTIESFENFGDMCLGLFKGMKDNLGEFVHPDKNLIEQMIGGLLHPYLPQLFLKQFPDGDGVSAVYQALTTSPAMINGFHGAGILGGDYEFNLEEFASEPMAEDIGLQIGTQPVALAFWINFDFAIEPPQELVNNSVVNKKKVAILGGGVAAMTTAFALTSQPDWKSRYDITLYQMGWRVGGKGASGRNQKMDNRIEEHGLHIWFGFYENAFKVMEEAYRELDRPAGAPLATVEEAFKPHSFVVLEEYIREEWKTWAFTFPIKDGKPGHGIEMVTLGQIVQTIYAWIKMGLRDLFEMVTNIDISHKEKPNPHGFGTLIRKWVDFFEEPLQDIIEDGMGLISLLDKWAEIPERIFQRDKQSDFTEALSKLKHWLDELIDGLLEKDDELRRLFIMADLGITVLRGMHDDDVLEKGFNSINNLDFKDWLRKHGANETFTVNSAPVRGLYDLVFGYQDGDITKPNFEAGTCLRGTLRMVFAYKGGIMYKMQAGMGDTVFTPLYQVLKRRGVDFKYFHKVEALLPDPDDNTRVGSIRMTKQVDLAKGETGYDPLINVNGLECWPSAPKYELLDSEQAQWLQENNINLESSWTDWPEVYHQKAGKPLEQITLEFGKDFDEVVFGLSVASLQYVCPKLLAISPPFQACADNIKSVVTQAYQLWMMPDLKEMGWETIPESGEEPVLTSFTEPMDTWASMDQLLCRETWPDNIQPKNASYFCGVQPISDFPPFTDYSFPKQCADKVKDLAVNQLNNDIKALWTNAEAPDGGFKWEWLADASNQQGAARFDSQYWRSNIDPSERYVQSVANSTAFRLDTNGTGFYNLYITGDWIKTGLNAGCVEAATMAGLQTSRAMCGYPKVIKGESDYG